MKHKKYKLSIAGFSVLWLILLTILFIPMTFPSVDGHYSDTRLLVTRRSAYGFHVLEGADELRAAIPLPHPEDLNTNDIIMTGKSIYDWTEYPHYYQFDYVITGRYMELTTQYQEATFGTIPVFQADTVTPVGRLVNWIDVRLGIGVLLVMGTLFFTLPLLIVRFCFLLRRKVI